MALRCPKVRFYAELKVVLEADNDEPIESLINPSWPNVPPETDQEHAAECASAAEVAVLPVVGEDGRPIGVITPIVLLEVLARGPISAMPAQKQTERDKGSPAFFWLLRLTRPT